jgi:hypothetical protein
LSAKLTWPRHHAPGSGQALRLQFDQPQDNVAVALAGLAQGRKAVDPDLLDPDLTLASRARLGCASPIEPRASVAEIASKAAVFRTKA